MKKLNITYDTAEIENGEKIIGETCYSVKMQDALAEQLLRDPGSCEPSIWPTSSFCSRAWRSCRAGNSWTAASSITNW